MDFLGSQFGNYKLMRLIGQGGFANVYKAWDTKLHRWVAIKVLRSTVTFEQREAFLKEARIMASMNHRYILPILSFDTYYTIPYLVLPYIPRSLQHLYPHGTIVPSDKVVSYIRQITKALFYIHQRGFVHQDVKPANLLLDEKGQVLVSDFGIVTVILNTGLQGNQEPIGTIFYMAPERFEGKAYPASDQYSLAVTAYEWMTGQYPHTVASHEEIRRHMEALGIPPAVQNVLLKALKRNPKDRYSTILEFAAALEQAIHLSTTSNQKDNNYKKQSAWDEMSLLLIGALVASIASGGIAYLFGENLSMALFIMQLGCLILPIPITIIWKNRLALKFALAIPVLVALVGVVLHSLLALWASPILVFLFAWFGVLQSIRHIIYH